MDKSVLCNTGWSLTRHTLAGFWTPVSAHIVETGGASGNEISKEHRNAVADVVFSGKGGRGFRAVPVKSRGKDSLGKIGVREPVGPLALSLESTGHRVAEMCIRDSSWDLTVQRFSFGALVLLGIVLLWFLCWYFTGKALRPIEENARRQNEFIAAASHELRSPLTVIRTRCV